MPKCLKCEFEFVPKSGTVGLALKYCGACRKAHYDLQKKITCVDCAKEFPDNGSKRTRCYTCNNEFLRLNSKNCERCW